jgi:hypothetical protein
LNFNANGVKYFLIRSKICPRSWVGLRSGKGEDIDTKKGRACSPESSPDVPKTVKEKPVGEFFLRLLQQPDEAPLKTPFSP